MERLAACVEELRVASGGAAELQTHQLRLLRELTTLQTHWPIAARPSPAANASAAGASPPSASALFQLLLQALLAYSGNFSGSSSVVASGASSSMSLPLLTSTATTSESVHQLLCELLARAYDYASAPVINEYMTGRHASIYVRTSLVMVIARLRLQDVYQFCPEAIAFANKNIKSADFYMRQCLLESVTRILAHGAPRLFVYLADAMKIVGKTFQDKTPEVRLATAALLHVIATHTTTWGSASQPVTGGITAAGAAANGTASTNGGNTVGGSTASSMNGSSASGTSSSTAATAQQHGVTLEAIIQIAYKGMDDAAPEVRRAFSVVVGVVLAKFATGGSYDLSAEAGRGNEDDGQHGGNDGESAQPGSTGKAKSGGFKLAGMHVPGMSTLHLSVSLSRRKTAAADFSSIANVILYLKDLLAAKYLTTTLQGQTHGGILAAYSVALCAMFERLPPDAISETQLGDIVAAIMSILDQPLTLSDLTRARNAVCFVFRYGLSGILTERQQEALVDVYINVVRLPESSHHKVLSCLAEMSHLMQSLGETSIVHARACSQTLLELLAHEKQSVRFQAAVTMASLVTCLPYILKQSLLPCMERLRVTTSLLVKRSTDRSTEGDDDEDESKRKTHLYAIQGHSTAIAQVVRALVAQGNHGLSHAILSSIFNLAERLVETQFVDRCPDSTWLTCTRAGWNLISSLVIVPDQSWQEGVQQRLFDMWLRSSVLQTREASIELLRIEGAAAALHSLLYASPSLVERSNNVEILAAHILHVYLVATQSQLSKPQKRRGQLARYRLIAWLLKTYTLLPPVYNDSLITLVDLVAEYTTSQSLTGLQHTSSPPAESTFLSVVLSSEDDALELVSLARLQAGDQPDAMYSRELNHILALSQLENSLSDVEVEVQFLDNATALACDRLNHRRSVYDRGVCSSVTSVRLVDASVYLFGRMFHVLPEDLQLRCLQHLHATLTEAQTECEVNVCSLLYAIVYEVKRGDSSHSHLPSNNGAWQHQVQMMLLDMLASENGRVRRGAAETLGSLAAFSKDVHVRSLVHELEKRLTPTDNAEPSINCAGAAFALACIKRSCGSGVVVDSGLVFRFAGEIAQPLRTWILHSWSIIVDSVSASGGDYEQYVKSSCALMEAHLVAGFRYSRINKKCVKWQVGARVSMGRIINGVIATLGPEVEASADRLDDFETLWTMLRFDGDARVELEYLKYLEQIVVFAPKHFQRSHLAHVLAIISPVDAFCSADVSQTGGQDEAGVAPPVGLDFDSINGQGRRLLQQVGLSCIRTLSERDPSVIREFQLPCVLFRSLHTEARSLSWRCSPSTQGIWDALTFKGNALAISGDPTTEIRNTILAMIDIDNSHKSFGELCVWALICRGIAIGESFNTSSTTNEQLMMSPKGMDLGMPGASVTDSAWVDSPQNAQVQNRETGAAEAQVDTWRKTKQHVRGLLSCLPVLSRHARVFAVECVVRIFELFIKRRDPDVKPHFDLSLAREVLTQTIHGSEAESSRNYLCMYLDEFVTLACQVATASTEGIELPMFQLEGLRLLHLLLIQFNDVRDPEVTSAEAYVLEPYQAQLSAAVRHAGKLAHARTESEGDDSEGFCAELAIKAFDLCGSTVRCGLIQDKIALGRILRLVVTKDYGHSHFIGDDWTRDSVTLANLASVANIVTSCIAPVNELSLKQPALSKALISNLGSNLDLLVSCWMEMTWAYGHVMAGVDHWPQLIQKNQDSSTVTSAVLKLSLPANMNDVASADLDKLRLAFRRYWAAVPLAMCQLVEAGAIGVEQLSAQTFLGLCILHIVTCAREDTDDIIPVLHAIPSILTRLQPGQECTQLKMKTLQSLAFIGAHCSGTTRLEALRTLFACLPRKTQDVPEALRAVTAECALSPLRILTSICEPSQKQRLVAARDEALLPEIVRLAALGIVHIRDMDGIRNCIIEAIPLVDRCLEFFINRPDHSATLAALHRAVMETSVSAEKDLGEDEREYLVEIVDQSCGSMQTLVSTTVSSLDGQVLKSDCVRTILRLTASYAVSPPASLRHRLSMLHQHVAGTAREVFSDEKKLADGVAGAWLSGIRAIAEKLIAVGDETSADRYIMVLAPLAIKRLDACSSSSAVPNMDELEAVDQVLRLLTTRVDDHHIAPLVQVLLSKIAAAIEIQRPHDVNDSVTTVLSRLLLHLAQTRPTHFKETVMNIGPSTRSVLETALRSALMKGAAGATTSHSVAASGATSLDLSRYKK
ncbi:hypothetical protein PINS_up003744 [Pythium insidiosum]|nr:hypothetical protein PINS_up003744 [Pythium insidiosum]